MTSKTNNKNINPYDLNTVGKITQKKTILNKIRSRNSDPYNASDSANNNIQK